MPDPQLQLDENQAARLLLVGVTGSEDSPADELEIEDPETRAEYDRLKAKELERQGLQ